MLLTRRRSMGLACASLVCFAGGASPALAQVDVLVRRFTGGKQVGEGRVTIDIDAEIDNGLTVPITLSAESPMTQADHARRLLLLAPENPFIRVAEFHFSPLSGRAAVATRIRLAASQELLAIAEMSDGSFWAGRRMVAVVSGGCG